jgi:hypothetical protein
MLQTAAFARLRGFTAELSRLLAVARRRGGDPTGTHPASLESIRNKLK